MLVPASRPGRRPAPTGTRRRATSAIVAVSALALIAPAVAGAEWSNVGPTSYTPPPDANGFPGPTSPPISLGQVTLGPDGTLTSTGGELAPGNRSVPPATVGQRPPGGSWPRGGSAPRFPALSPTTYGPPTVSYGDDGSAALVVGARSGGRVSSWGLSVRGDDGTWGTLGAAGPADAGLQLNLRMVVDHSGRLVVLWLGQYDAAGVSPILTSSRPLEGGDWTAPKQIGTAETGPYIDTFTRIYGGPTQTSGVLSQPYVATDGSITVSWTTGSKTINATGAQPASRATGLKVARRSAAGTWSTPTSIATPEAAGGGYVGQQLTAVDDRGGVVAALTGVDAAGKETTRAWVLRGGSSAWGTPVTLASAPTRLAAVGDGQAAAVSLVQQGPADAPVQVARAQTTTDGGRRWSAPRTVSSEGGSVRGVSLVANRTPGMITLGLTTTTNTLPDAQTRGTARDWYPWSDSFTRVYDVPDALRANVVGTDPAGDTALQVFTGTTSNVNGVDIEYPSVVVDDVSGPDIDGLTAPVTIKPKKAGTFTVEATDAFSKLGTSTWDFGDGTTATGASVQHAFAKAGTYPVSVTVTDEWGYPTATSTTVRVAKKIGLTSVAARLPGAGRKRTVRVSRIRLSAGRLSLRSTGSAKLLVSVQRRTAAGVPSGPARIVRLQPQGAGAITARLRGLRSGRYRVRVSADASSSAKVVRRGAILRIGR